MGLFSKKEEPKPVIQGPIITHFVLIYKDEAGEWRSRIKSSNGNIIADSGEGYKNELDCRRAFENLRHAFQNGSYRVEVEGREPEEAD
jgi:uncharacterized protein YegP (UPF0339 family)